MTPKIRANQTFTNLVTIEPTDPAASAWHCICCQCGKQFSATADELTNGSTQDCGCKAKQARRAAA